MVTAPKAIERDLMRAAAAASGTASIRLEPKGASRSNGYAVIDQVSREDRERTPMPIKLSDS